MSDTIHTLVPAESTAAVPDRRGAIAISVVTQATFLLVLIAAGVLYAMTKDQVIFAFLATMGGYAANNATSVVGYWVGSSAGSDKKTDLLARAPPIGTKP